MNFKKLSLSVYKRSIASAIAGIMSLSMVPLNVFADTLYSDTDYTVELYNENNEGYLYSDEESDYLVNKETIESEQQEPQENPYYTYTYVYEIKYEYQLDEYGEPVLDEYGYPVQVPVLNEDEIDSDEIIDNEIDSDEIIDNETDSDESIDNESDSDESIDNETDSDETIDNESDSDESIDNETDSDESIDNESDSDESIDNETDSSDETIDNESDSSENEEYDTDNEIDYHEQLEEDTDDLPEPEYFYDEYGNLFVTYYTYVYDGENNLVRIRVTSLVTVEFIPAFAPVMFSPFSISAPALDNTRYILLSDRTDNWNGITISRDLLYDSYYGYSDVIIRGSVVIDSDNTMPTSNNAAVMLNGDTAGQNQLSQHHGIMNSYSWNGSNFIFQTGSADAQVNIDFTAGLVSDLRIQTNSWNLDGDTDVSSNSLRIYDIIIDRNGVRIFDLAEYLSNTSILSIVDINHIANAGGTATIVRPVFDYSITFDLQNMLASDGDISAPLQNAGVTPQVVDMSGNTFLRVGARTNDWNGIDIQTTNLVPGQILRIAGRVYNPPSEITMVLGGADSPWSWATHQNVSTHGQEFILQLEITAEHLSEPGIGAFDRFRIQTNDLGALTTFYIYNIEIFPNGVNPPSITIPPLDTHPNFIPTEYGWTGQTHGVIFDFARFLNTRETGALNGFGQAPLQGAGPVQFDIVNQGGRNALRVHGRELDWHTLDVERWDGIQPGDRLIIRGFVPNAHSGVGIAIQPVRASWWPLPFGPNPLGAGGNFIINLGITQGILNERGQDDPTQYRFERFRIQTHQYPGQFIGDFFITDLQIYRPLTVGLVAAEPNIDFVATKNNFYLAYEQYASNPDYEGFFQDALLVINSIETNLKNLTDGVGFYVTNNTTISEVVEQLTMYLNRLSPNVNVEIINYRAYPHGTRWYSRVGLRNYYVFQVVLSGSPSIAVQGYGAAFAYFNWSLIGGDSSNLAGGFLRPTVSNPVTVTTNLAGGTFPSGRNFSSLTMQSGLSFNQMFDTGIAAQIPQPIREGFRFRGWYVGNQRVTLNTPITSNVTLTASWSLRPGFELPEDWEDYVPEAPVQMLFSEVVFSSQFGPGWNIGWPLQDAGNPSLNIVSHGAGYALRVGGRTANWHAVDILRDSQGWPMQVGDVIQISGQAIDAPAGTYMVVGAVSSPWSWAANVPVEGNQDFNITIVVTEELMSAPHFERFRIQTNEGDGATIDFILTQILVGRP